MFRIAVWTLQIAATVALLVASANPTYAQRGRGGGGGSRGVSGTTHSGSYGGYSGGSYGGYRDGYNGGYRGGYYGGSGVYIGLGWPGYNGGYSGYGYYPRSYYGGSSYPYYSDYYYADTPTVSGYYSLPALTTTNEATVNVHVLPDAQVWFDGSATSQRGEWRAFGTPPLDTGQDFHYDVRSRWTDANGQAVDQTRRVDVRAGQTTTVDFIRPRQ